MGQWLGKIRYGMFPQGLYNINHMPIPYTMPDEYDDKRFLSQNDTELKWLLWPRRCHVSQKWLWLTQAYCAGMLSPDPVILLYGLVGIVLQNI